MTPEERKQKYEDIAVEEKRALFKKCAEASLSERGIKKAFDDDHTRNIAIRLQLEDVLVVYGLSLDSFDGDVRAAIAKLVEWEIAVHDDPQVNGGFRRVPPPTWTTCTRCGIGVDFDGNCGFCHDWTDHKAAAAKANAGKWTK